MRKRFQQDVGLARYIMHTHVATASVPMGTFAYAAPGTHCSMFTP